MDMVQTIRQVVEKSIEWSHPVVIPKLDFKKAYVSVTRAAIAHALGSLDNKSLRAAFLREIVDQTISFVLEDVSSDPVHMTRGLLQGDPGSPAVFSACVDNLDCKLRAWRKKSDKFFGINVDGYTSNALYWLDDIYFVAPDIATAQRMLNDVRMVAHEICGLQLQAAKCCWSSTLWDHGDQDIVTGGMKLERKSKEEGISCLGSQVSFTGTSALAVQLRIARPWGAFFIYKDV